MKCPRCQYDNPSETNFCGKCGWQLSAAGKGAFLQTETLIAPLFELERGSTFAGRYEVIEELGKGGMGRVYKVFDKKIKESVALKLLKPEIATDERTIERFSNELRFARKISHRNVCRMYDLGQDGTTFFITMEYVSGEDLKSFIKRSGHLTEAKAVSIAEQICQGLAEAHHLGVMHRDLKPQNIMIDREGNARIMDFGIARSLQAQGITGTGMLIGTPEYMSPEQAEGEVVDQRSDIYSLGVILYEMVTGRVPFAGETPLSIALKHINAVPKNPREINTLVSEGLSRTILKCLEKPREKRFQSARELHAELENIEKGIPTVEKIIVERKPATSSEITVKLDLKKVVIPALILTGVALVGLKIWRSLPHEQRVIRSGPQSHRALPQPPAPSSAPSEKQVQDEIGRWVSELAKKQGPESKNVTGFLAMVLKEAAAYLGSQDYDELRKTMDVIKSKIPADSRLMTMWNDTEAKIKQAQENSQAGKIQESQKSYEEGQNQMRDLLAQVEEKDKADAAGTEMEQEKKRAEGELPEGKENLLFRVAVMGEKGAADAYKRDDFSGAKTYYLVLKNVFGLSIRADNPDSGLRALRNYVQALGSEADSQKAAELASWHYGEAKKEEARAEAFLKEKEYAAAAETYIRAAFLYEKAKEKSSGVPRTR